MRGSYLTMNGILDRESALDPRFGGSSIDSRVSPHDTIMALIQSDSNYHQFHRTARPSSRHQSDCISRVTFAGSDCRMSRTPRQTKIQTWVPRQPETRP